MWIMVACMCDDVRKTNARSLTVERAWEGVGLLFCRDWVNSARRVCVTGVENDF